MVSDERVRSEAELEELMSLVQDQYQDMLSNHVIWPEENCISLDIQIGADSSRGGETRTRADLFDEDGHLVPTGKRRRGYQQT